MASPSHAAASLTGNAVPVSQGIVVAASVRVAGITPLPVMAQAQAAKMTPVPAMAQALVRAAPVVGGGVGEHGATIQ